MAQKQPIKHGFARGFTWLVLIHTGLLTAFWLTNSLFYVETNDYLARMLGARLDYILLVLAWSGAMILWSVARLIWPRLAVPRGLANAAGILFGLLGAMYVVFFYGSFWMLFKESPVQVTRLGQLLLYYRVILDPILLIALALLAGFGLRRILLGRIPMARQRFIAAALALLAVLGAAWGMMLAAPPSSVYPGSLPAKPLIIAHRGASFHAPENTLASAELAVQLGVFGLETDVVVSQDGIPYLMHDDTLLRTTDVAAVFPGREKARAETFSLAEVQRLNAGEWFTRRDPYRTIASGAVRPELLAEGSRQAVPTLEQELAVVRRSGLTFIYDLKQPPAGHPYSQSYFDLVFRQVRSAGVDAQVWFLAKTDQLAAVRQAAPQMKLTAGIDSDTPPLSSDLLSAGYQVVNSEYNLAPASIRAYQAGGLWVNLWTVDEPWQFSRLWILGVNSITTSNAAEMVALTQPVLGLPYSTYFILWIVLGIIAWLVGLAAALRQRQVPATRQVESQ